MEIDQNSEHRKERCFTEENFREKVAISRKQSLVMLAVVWENGATEETKRRLEYFFDTNSNKKANALIKTLRAMGYHIEKDASHRPNIRVKGWTTEMKLAAETVLSWEIQMLKTGFEHDCIFNGWGTYNNPAAAGMFLPKALIPR